VRHLRIVLIALVAALTASNLAAISSGAAGRSAAATMPAPAASTLPLGRGQSDRFNATLFPRHASPGEQVVIVSELSGFDAPGLLQVRVAGVWRTIDRDRSAPIADHLSTISFTAQAPARRDRVREFRIRQLRCWCEGQNVQPGRSRVVRVHSDAARILVETTVASDGDRAVSGAVLLRRTSSGWRRFDPDQSARGRSSIRWVRPNVVIEHLPPGTYTALIDGFSRHHDETGHPVHELVPRYLGNAGSIAKATKITVGSGEQVNVALALPDNGVRIPIVLGPEEATGAGVSTLGARLFAPGEPFMLQSSSCALDQCDPQLTEPLPAGTPRGQPFYTPLLLPGEGYQILVGGHAWYFYTWYGDTLTQEAASVLVIDPETGRPDHIAIQQIPRNP